MQFTGLTDAAPFHPGLGGNSAGEADGRGSGDMAGQRVPDRVDGACGVAKAEHAGGQADPGLGHVMGGQDGSEQSGRLRRVVDAQERQGKRECDGVVVGRDPSGPLQPAHRDTGVTLVLPTSPGLPGQR